MSEVIERKYHQTIDFDSLMREARKHITALAGDLWSDHNASDPGITQLEVLAFCIADLSYRTSFDVKDILKGYKGDLTTVKDMPLADVALPNNPVTIKDLRKVLIDMAHPKYLHSAHLPKDDQYPTKLLVRNAFPIIAERTEVPFYAASKYGRDTFLTFDTNFDIYVKDDEYDNSPPPPPRPHRDEMYSPEIEMAEKLKAKGVADFAKREVHISPPPPRDEAYPDEVIKLTAIEATHSIDDEGVEGLYTAGGTYKTKKAEFENLDEIILNGLYALQIEFENDGFYKREGNEIPFLYDLNQNYFKGTINANGEEYSISVLFPYWDDIKWSLKDVDFSTASLSYASRLGRDYFIAVDKLNYDDYFYDYYAEVETGNHRLPLFIKITTELTDEITINGNTHSFEVDFLDWNELSNGVSRNYSDPVFDLNPPVNGIAPTDLHVRNVGVDDENYTFDIHTSFTFNKEKYTKNDDGTLDGPTYKEKTINLLARFIFADGTVFSNADLTSVENALKAKYKNLVEKKIKLEKALFEYIGKNTSSIYADYSTKINAVFKNLYGDDGIWQYLGKYRNICEDYSKFTASRVQEIALFGKVIAEPEYNVNELLAEIYFRVDQFLSPLVKFNSLGEMTAKGYEFDDLFNGPLLENGFIDDKDLKNLKRRAVVYTSDLIRIIMDVPGVLAVEGFNISSYIDNRLMGRNVLNCLNLTNSDIYKPRFTGEKTKLEVWVNDKKEAIDKESLKIWYAEKLKEAKNEQIPAEAYSGLEAPMGEDREIEAYHSIQHDFPEVYGIGEYGLPLDATDQRKAQAKQLKAYLLPFEQLLANYLKQVATLPELFSYHRDIDSTYAFQPLYEVPDVQPLFQGFVQSQDTWETFKDDLDHIYAKKLDEGAKQDYESRRSRLLSHLLARFGESFEAYARQLFSEHKALLDLPNGITAYREAQAATLKRLINDKIAFGEDYWEVSAERYKSFNAAIAPQDDYYGIWNNANIESYKRRLCRLLGISQVNNANIFQAHTDVHGVVHDIEGMHIVEHILLRPRTTLSDLIDLNNRPFADQEGSYIYDADLDPYSFTVSIVLPKAAGRFKSASFREFTERLIRMETPAHIRINFKWLSGDCGKRFEANYSTWKQNVHLLKPYFFQNIDSVKEIDWRHLMADTLVTGGIKPDRPVEELVIKEGRTKYSEPYEIPDERQQSIIELKNKLIQVLETPCTLKLQLYNATDALFSPSSGAIRFEDKTTDVFHMRVSETGGRITVRKKDGEGNWNEVADFGPITSTYFDVNDYLDAHQGLTTKFGGKGLYKVTYTLPDRTPVSELIAVTRAIVPVDIFIGNQDVMLDFDTETDGVFSISNKNWAGHFLQFMPTSNRDTESFGTAYIESEEKGLEKTVLWNGLSDNHQGIKFQEIFDRFGPGKYRITYELDGQITFADIELTLELSITVFDGDIQLTPNDDGKIIIPAGIRVFDLVLDLPGGGLKVYNLDAPFGIHEMDDAHMDGSMAYYKKAERVSINRDEDERYIDGHHFRFVYDFHGYETDVVIYLEPTLVELPTVKLFDGKEEMLEEPKVLVVDGKVRPYSIQFHPKDAEVEAWVLLDDGTKKILESFTVTQDYLTEPIKAAEVYGEVGPGPIHVTCSNDAGTAYLSFTIRLEIEEPPKETTLTIFDSNADKLVDPKEGIYNLVYNYKNPEHYFELRFNNPNGELFLFDEDENEYATGIEGHAIRFNGTEPLLKGLLSGDYKGVYYPQNGPKIEFVLNVINLNPEFVLEDIFYERPYYYATARPLYPHARTYIWRVNGKYKSRAKQPKLQFDFVKNEKVTVELTMHLEDYEASSFKELTLEEFKNLKAGE